MSCAYNINVIFISLTSPHPYTDLITFVRDRPGHDRRYAINAGKIDRELGWTPDVKFDDGFKSTVEWYLENKIWWQPLLERSETQARQGLGKAPK